MDPDVERFLELLGRATATLDMPYFALPVDGQARPEFRERVYAYELYHQLRSIWPPPEEWHFVLNGEVDKRGHPLLEGDFVVNRVPDLLVHRPGRMADNLVILEIKSVDASRREIADDFRKLTAFCRQADYRQGVLLLFGDTTSARRVAARCNQAVADAGADVDREFIRVYWHAAARARAAEVAWEGAAA